MSLRNRLENKELLVGTWLTIAAPSLIEGLGGTGLDFVIIDLEHGESGLEAHLTDMIRAGDAFGVDILVRLPAWQLGIAGRIFDMGACGLVIPQVEDQNTITYAIQSSRFPPSGRRGLSIQTRAGKYGGMETETFVKGDHGNPILLIQIESLKGIEKLQSIVEVQKLDGVLLGPSDLAFSLANAPESDLSLETALNQVAQVTLEHDLALGNVCADMAGVQRCLEMGTCFLVLSGGLLWKSYSELITAIRTDIHE